MPRARLTDDTIRKLPPAEKGTVWYSDDKLPGFQLSIGTRTRTFYVVKSLHGRNIRKKLGEWPGVTAKAAREAAEQVRGAISQGIDPRRKKLATLDEVLDDYTRFCGLDTGSDETHQHAVVLVGCLPFKLDAVLCDLSFGGLGLIGVEDEGLSNFPFAVFENGRLDGGLTIRIVCDCRDSFVEIAEVGFGGILDSLTVHVAGDLLLDALNEALDDQVLVHRSDHRAVSDRQKADQDDLD